jgi:hypothetical protein
MTLSPNSRAVEKEGVSCHCCWTGFRVAEPGIFCESAGHSVQTNHVRGSLTNFPVKSQKTGGREDEKTAEIKRLKSVPDRA